MEPGTKIFPVVRKDKNNWCWRGYIGEVCPPPVCWNHNRTAGRGKPQEALRGPFLQFTLKAVPRSTAFFI